MSKRPQLPGPGTDLNATVEDISSRGAGVARTADGLVAMVPGTVPGEEIIARVTAAKKGYVEARLERIVRASEDRVEPFCAHYGQCGGCVLQHVAAPAQRRLKTERLRRLLGKLADVRPEIVREAVEVGPATGFRGRMELALSVAGEGMALGLHDHGGAVFDLTECHLPPPDVVDVVHDLRRCVIEGRLPVADPAAGRRGLRRVDIRKSSRGEILVAWETDGRLPPEMLDALTRPARAGRVASVVLSLRGRGGARSSASRRRVLAGSGRLEETFLDLCFRIDETTFVQTHHGGAEALYRQVIDWVGGDQGPFLDLYAGIGVVSVALGRHRPAVAIEQAPGAVDSGRAAARAAGSTVRFRRTQVNVALARLVGSAAVFSSALANPPQAGLHATVAVGLHDLGVRRLAYVSCNPATLARDLARLAAAGFHAREVVPFDLFPQTAELEVAALVERPGS